MTEQIPEFDAYDMWLDYCAEMKEAGEEPLEFYEWCRENQVEPI